MVALCDRPVIRAPKAPIQHPILVAQLHRAAVFHHQPTLANLDTLRRDQPLKRPLHGRHRRPRKLGYCRVLLIEPPAAVPLGKAAELAQDQVVAMICGVAHSPSRLGAMDSATRFGVGEFQRRRCCHIGSLRRAGSSPKLRPVAFVSLICFDSASSPIKPAYGALSAGLS